MKEGPVTSKEETEILREISKNLVTLINGQKKVIQLLKDLSEKRSNEKKGVAESDTQALDVVTQLSLPDNIRKTALALSKLGEATAEEVAKETERTRAIESAYLNQLQRMGYINRKRKGHMVIYFIS